MQWSSFLRRLPVLAALCLAVACRAQPAATPSPTAVVAGVSSAAAASSTPAPVVNRSQLLPSGIRIEEHALVRRPEIEPLVLLALDGENEVQLQRTHAELLHERVRPESYYSGGNLWIMQGKDKLEAVEIDGPNVAAVRRNGEPFFSVANDSPGVTTPFRVLTLYDDHWVLELAQRIQNADSTAYFSGRVFVDGRPLDDEYGYEESFGFQTMAGMPFYLFRRGGAIGVVVDGQEVALGYDEVPHYGCCSAGALNPRVARNMLAFFARRGERWYYVEIGAFDEDR